MNPMRSVAAKLAGLTTMVVLVVIALMARRLFTATEQGLIGEMQVRAEFFARSAREAIFPKLDPFSLHFHVEELLREKAVTYASVQDPSGRVLSHSDPKLIGDTPTDPVSRRALASEAPLLQRFETRDGGRRYDLSVPILVGSRRVGTARLGFDQSSIDEALAAPKRQIAVIAAGSLSLAVLGALLVVGWITRPLPRLAAAAREVGRGNFKVAVDWKSRDEIGMLAKAFNDMAVANALLFDTIQHEKEKLETIFHDTREGMIWTDPRGRVLLINPSARALLGCQERAVDDLSGLLKSFKASPPLAEVLAGRRRITPCEFQRAEPKLLIVSGVADRLGREGDHQGFLFIFHDATIEKRGETLSRNFLSLVSHKLRTPLAVALGFLELMRAENKNLNDFQKNALKKVQDEDEKLRGLVEKLITFSAVQNPEHIVLERAETSLLETVQAALKYLSSNAALKKFDLRWKAEEFSALPKLPIDSLLVREVLVNLIENAVKFNPREPKVVELSVENVGKAVQVLVRDNGPGIPSEEHPRLFRKFYQVDEHFTGQIPGMGLGLAFVKNVIEAHGGTVGMSSEPGRGSEFRFTLPSA